MMETDGKELARIFKDHYHDNYPLLKFRKYMVYFVDMTS